eukprot:SAG22_NODE_1005_length_6077_cov_3.132653_7_plen_125_part_01
MASTSDVHSQLGLEMGNRPTNTTKRVQKVERVLRAPGAMNHDSSDSDVSSDEEAKPAASNPARRRVLAPSTVQSTEGGGSSGFSMMKVPTSTIQRPGEGRGGGGGGGGDMTPPRTPAGMVRPRIA